MGMIRGLVSPVSQITNASGPLVASIAFDASGNYAMILTVFLVTALTGSMFWLFATPPKKPQPALAVA
jgi:hypothetical protein